MGCVVGVHNIHVFPAIFDPKRDMTSCTVVSMLKVVGLMVAENNADGIPKYNSMPPLLIP